MSDTPSTGVNLTTVVKTTPVSKQHANGCQIDIPTGVKLTHQQVSKQHTHKEILNTLKENKEIYVHFDRFWNAYPRKEVKTKTLEVFAKINLDAQLIEKKPLAPKFSEF